MALLLNPKAWIAALAAAFALFVGVTLWQNDHMRQKIDAQEQTIEQLHNDAEVLKGGQEALKNDISRLDDIANFKQTVVIREQSLSNDLQAIPKTNDRPFADPNNLSYAGILRTYQESVTRELTPDQSE